MLVLLMGVVRTDRLDLVVAERGEGGRPLLVLHGFTGAKEDFADHLEAFAGEGWHVVAPDHRGHGESPKPPGEDQYSIDHFVQDTLSLADALGWDRFGLLGHSMGGMIAQQLTLDAPDRVEALILMDTHHGSPDSLDPEMIALGVAVAREQGMAALAELLASMEGGPLDTAANQRLIRERPERREQSGRNTRVCSADMFVAMAHQLLDQEDRLERLSEITAPTLVLVGEEDVPFLAPSEAMARVIPAAELRVISSGGHSPQLEAPDAWWEAVSGFLAEALPPVTAQR